MIKVITKRKVCVKEITMAMISHWRDKKVSLDVLICICEVLDCDIGDIMSVHKEEMDGEKE